MPDTVWIAGDAKPDRQWEVVGVFDSEKKAVAACRTPFQFVGPVTLNERFPDDRVEWPGAYYPIKATK